MVGHPGAGKYVSSLTQTSVNTANQPAFAQSVMSIEDIISNTFHFTGTYEEQIKETTFHYELSAKNCVYGPNPQTCSIQTGIPLTIVVPACQKPAESTTAAIIPTPVAPVPTSAAPATTTVAAHAQADSTWGIESLHYNFKSGSLSFAVQAESDSGYVSTLVQTSQNAHGEPTLVAGFISVDDIVANIFPFTASVECAHKAAGYKYLFEATTCVNGANPQKCFKQNNVEVSFSVTDKCLLSDFEVKLI
ncbi:hypothetical protein HDU98_004777 [Podochytrium sp. JEL0797]|nr:hypothetical protein HDU98_004777 [Podochytrium sp. JEL0797]